MIPMGISRGGGGEGGGRNRGLVERVVRCHERIRAFLAIAQRIVAREGDLAERGDAAADVARYFSTAYVDHARDEDESVFPRLPASVADLAARASAEHVREDALVRALVGECELLADGAHDDAVYDALASALTELAPRLTEHLAFEEEHLVPAMAALAPETEREILDEMAARRDASR